MTSTRTSTRLCLVRHGETDWNIERRIQGHIDIELNAVGLRQAQATTHGIRNHQFAALYSSDLTRTMQTATVLSDVVGLDAQAEAGLRERHYGRVQGMTYEELLAADEAEAARFRARVPDHDFGGGETLLSFAQRIGQTVERLAAQHRGQNVLLVTHGGVLDIVYRRAVGRDLMSPRDFAVPNAALNWIEAGPDHWRLIAWADRQHLERTLEQSVE